MNELRTIENMKAWMNENYELGWYDDFWEGVEKLKYVGLITEEEYAELKEHGEHLQTLFDKKIDAELAEYREKSRKYNF